MSSGRSSTSTRTSPSCSRETTPGAAGSSPPATEPPSQAILEEIEEIEELLAQLRVLPEGLPDRLGGLLEGLELLRARRSTGVGPRHRLLHPALGGDEGRMVGLVVEAAIDLHDDAGHED